MSMSILRSSGESNFELNASNMEVVQNKKRLPEAMPEGSNKRIKSVQRIVLPIFGPQNNQVEIQAKIDMPKPCERHPQQHREYPSHVPLTFELHPNYDKEPPKPLCAEKLCLRQGKAPVLPSPYHDLKWEESYKSFAAVKGLQTGYRIELPPEILSTVGRWPVTVLGTNLY